ncbi:MAG: DUF2089 domain-containing protein [Anaerolineales bacterium]|nr:DUF2089 domain-containing protein [Anaerolineales bacterium]
MHPIPGKCPVCNGELFVTRLQCRECDTSIEGRFFTSPFAALTPEQLEFVELFIRNEGKLRYMEKDLSLSYPTVRNRLHEVIRTLGFEPGGGDAGGLSEEERRQILENLNAGNISSEEAMEMLSQ